MLEESFSLSPIFCSLAVNTLQMEVALISGVNLDTTVKSFPFPLIKLFQLSFENIFHCYKKNVSINIGCKQ